MTQSPRELVAQSAKFRREQERLLQDLLGILDSLDRACDHWQQAEQEHYPSQSASGDSMLEPAVQESLPTFWRWKQALQRWLGQQPQANEKEASANDAMGEVISSAKEGVEMIRRSLLDLLRQRQVVPLTTQGQVFDPERMYALGREESAEAEENTVVREVVRGYLWQNQILREAQVMVAVKPADEDRHQA
jgi:molecular chaperone GrpE (heat shock protein)